MQAHANQVAVKQSINSARAPKACTSHGFLGLQNYNDNKSIRHRNLQIKSLP